MQILPFHQKHISSEEGEKQILHAIDTPQYHNCSLRLYHTNNAPLQTYLSDLPQNKKHYIPI